MYSMSNCLNTVMRWVPKRTALNLKMVAQHSFVFNASLAGCAASRLRGVGGDSMFLNIFKCHPGPAATDRMDIGNGIGHPPLTWWLQQPQP